MLATNRPRRSALYMPGSNARALDKARSLAADVLIFDLEDAVAPEAKEAARAQVVAALAQGGYGRRETIVRINALTTPWGEADIAAIAGLNADALLIPKVEDAATVRAVEALMVRAGAPAGMALWCMMETPLGILRAAEIASASPRLGGLVMGTSDLAKDLNCRHTPDRQPLLTALGLCLLAARAHGLAILDGVHLDLEDEAGFEQSCRQGRDLGFDGKTLIHPKTIAAANQAFAPDADEIAWSRRVIAAFAQAETQGKGVVVLEGKLIESLHAAQARRLVELAEMIEDAATPSGGLIS